MTKTDIGRFPSPLGDLYISINRKIETNTGIPVSVPSRGLIYLNETINILAISDGFSFRPLSGTYISQFSTSYSAKQRGAKVSVPSRGLIYLNKTMKFKELLGVGFRPLSGTYISQSETELVEWVYNYRFRPLSGTYISQ